MNVQSDKHVRLAVLGKNPWRSVAAFVAACCVGLLAVIVVAGTPCRAAAIPAWLDDGISKWNAQNPDVPIRFVAIKDSFVWYDVPMTSAIGQQRIRDGVNKIVLEHGYEPLDEEELITTAKVPVASGPSPSKKCWSRSFVLNIQSQNNTKAVGDVSPGQRQRMLTRLVCEDTQTWWAAFRVVQ